MKGILVILDGIGDLPHRILENQTPLEAARTPNLDFFAARGEIGYMYPVKPGFIPESDEAIVSIFGNELVSSTRGQLEARGIGVRLVRGDLAFRVNFATIDNLQNGNIVDRRVGRTLTTEEAKALAKALNKIIMPFKFDFLSTVQHRAVLVFRGGFSDGILGNDFTYLQGRSQNMDKISPCKPTDDEENSQYTANVVNDFLRKAYEVLESHSINRERVRKGFLPANCILLRGGGIEAPKLRLYRKWISSSYTPLEIGFSRMSGMNVFSFEYPKLKGLDAYQNLYEGLEKACKFNMKVLEKTCNKFDYAYIHMKETDLPGHDNKPLEKKQMIEYIDKVFFGFLKRFAPQRGIHIVVTGDHSTPCKLKMHSADPVPVLLYNNSLPREKRFCESEAKRGALGRMNGNELLDKVGFNR